MKTAGEFAVELGQLFGGNGMSHDQQVAEAANRIREREAGKEAFFRAAEKAIDQGNISIRRMARLRKFMGYVQNGSEQVIVLFQDDATKDFYIKRRHPQKPFYYGPTLEAAIDAIADSELEP